MRCTAPVKSFQAALATVMPAVATSKMQPILECVTLTVTPNDGLRIEANSIERAIVTHIEMAPGGFEFGAVAVQARALQQSVALLSRRDDVTMAIKGNRLEIASGDSHCRLAVPNDLEPLQVQEPAGSTQSIELHPVVFREAIEAVAYAADHSGNRPVLLGVRLSFDGEHLEYTALDGHRMARLRTKVERAGEFLAIIPAPDLQAVARALPDEGIVILTVGEGGRSGLTKVECGPTSWYLRRLTGEWPGISGLVLDGFTGKIELPRTLFQEIAEGAVNFATERDMPLMEVLADSDGVKVRARNYHRSMMIEVHGAKILEGEPAAIGLNATYVRDALRALGGEKVVLSHGGVTYVVFRKPKESIENTHLLMTIGVKETPVSAESENVPEENPEPVGVNV